MEFFHVFRKLFLDLAELTHSRTIVLGGFEHPQVLKLS
jgi:hypothetical protein